MMLDVITQFISQEFRAVGLIELYLKRHQIMITRCKILSIGLRYFFDGIMHCFSCVVNPVTSEDAIWKH